MKNFTKFSLRFVVYLTITLYLLCDFVFFQGPLSKYLQTSLPNSPEQIAKAKANGVVARVFNHHITRSQLDYAIQEKLWLAGKSFTKLRHNEKKLVTYAALGDLIDHQLLRVKTKVNTFDLIVTDAEIEERVKRFVSRFESKAALYSGMKSIGIPDEKSLRQRLAARIQQEKYVALRVDPLVNVTPEEIAAFYQENQQALALPARIHARHIFIATLDRPSSDAKAILTNALEELYSGKTDFSALARKHSEDYANKDIGGELGWLTHERLPHDIAKAAFDLPLNKPALIQSSLGWHIFSVTERLPATSRTLQETESEIRNSLTLSKRHQALHDFRIALRKFETEKIDIFHDQLSFD